MKRRSQIQVAFFLTSFRPGGTERQMTELIRRLDRHQFDVHVACFHRDGTWLPRVESCATVTEFPVRGFANPSAFRHAAAFARWCRARRIAVLQTCDLYANTFALPAAMMAGVPIRIGSRRELNPDKTRAQLRLQRWAYRCATLVVANSRSAAQALAAEGLHRRQIEMIPNGVAIENHPPRARSGDVRIVLTVANLRKEKAHEVLFHAAARLLPRHPALRFQIVGDGPRAGELRALAASLGIDAHVDFLGHREDVPALLAAADAFVLPSRSEAFPNGVIEAMAAGLPVIATRVGGLIELVDEGRTGMLVPPDDADALAAAVGALAASPRRAIELGLAARDQIARHYSFDRMVQAFERLYLASLHASGAAAASSAAAA